MAEKSLEESVTSSTWYDKRWATNNILRSYELEYPDGTLEERIDYADWRLTSLLKRLRGYRNYTYKGGEKFTTIMQEQYGNTTAYRIVLMFNGFFHPYEIPNGANIKLPYPEDMEALITQLNIKKNDLAGRSVVI